MWHDCHRRDHCTSDIPCDNRRRRLRKIKKPTLPCFQVITLWKRAHKFLFSKGQVCSQKLLPQIVANINVKRFHIVTHSNAATFSMKILFFMKLAMLFKKLKYNNSTTRDSYTELYNFLVTSFTSAVIWKQILLHGNKIVQYIRNCICSGVDRHYFRKYLYSCAKFMKRNGLKMSHKFSKAFQF